MTSYDSSPPCTARSLEDETRNAERPANRNPEWWGDFSQPVKIEKIKFLGISPYRVELRFWLDLNSEVSRSTNSNWDLCLIWIWNWLRSPHHAGFRFAFLSPFRVSSSRERAVWALGALIAEGAYAEDTNLFPRVLHKLGSYSGLWRGYRRASDS